MPNIIINQVFVDIVMHIFYDHNRFVISFVKEKNNEYVLV